MRSGDLPITKIVSKPPVPVKVNTNNSSIVFLGEHEMPITRERTADTYKASSSATGATTITIGGHSTTVSGDAMRLYVSSRENKSR